MSTAKEFAVFDITILDEEGRVVVDIAEFIMIRVRDKGLLAAPTAVVSHVMVREMGGDTGLAGAIIVGTTAASLLTYLGWLAIL